MTDTATGAGTDTGSSATTTTTETTGADTATAELEKWKALAQKHENRAKENAAAAKKLETLEQQHMTETEKAIAQARKEGLAEGHRSAAAKVVRAEIRAAAAGRNVDVDALVEAIDLAKFADDDGEPDTKAIRAWMDKIAPAGDGTEQTETSFDLGQGTRTSSQNMALNGDPLLKAVKSKLGIS
jgi:hypothetical protein